MPLYVPWTSQERFPGMKYSFIPFVKMARATHTNKGGDAARAKFRKSDCQLQPEVHFVRRRRGVLRRVLPCLRD